MRPRPKLKWFIWATVALVYATGLEVQFACGGPGGPATIFHAASTPSPHYAEFAGGALGILDERFRQSQLVVAYRYLTGRPLSAQEQAAVVEFWRGKPRTAEGSDSAARAWQKATRTDTARDAKIIPHKYIHGYGFYILNCPNGAFRAATERYHSYVETYGVEARSTRRWLRAQRQVFTSCGDFGDLPAAPDSSFDPVEQADRHYQIAAAQFYRGAYRQAHRLFLEISRDSDSHWRPWGVYLAARARLRQGSIQEKPEHFESAIALFERVLEAPESEHLHQSSEGLIRLARLRLGAEAAVELPRASEALQRELPSVDAGAALVGYARLLARARQEEDAALDPMSEWIAAFRSPSRAFQPSVPPARMDAPTLLLALQRARAEDAEIDGLIEAALAVSATDPAYDTARFHAGRLLIDLGRVDEARAALTQATAPRTAPPSLSTRNRLAGLRLATARTTDEFFHDAVRRPLSLIYSELSPREVDLARSSTGFRDLEAMRFLSDESREFLNRSAPIELLATASRRETLDRHLRRSLAAAAWTRAVMLGRREAVTRLSQELESLAPEVSERLRRVRTATDGAWRSEAVLMILDQPGWSPFIRPGHHQGEPLDEFHGVTWNWWSVDPPYAAPGRGEFRVLADDERTRAVREFETLRAAGSAATFLGEYVVAWAEANPDDPRVPRALHRIVYLTRHCCTSEDKGEISKAAFDLLHRRYPGSEWAEKTPYWFR